MAAFAFLAFFSAIESWVLDPSGRLGVVVPLTEGVFDLDGAADGDFALESIVIVTGPCDHGVSDTRGFLKIAAN